MLKATTDGFSTQNLVIKGGEVDIYRGKSEEKVFSNLKLKHGIVARFQDITTTTMRRDGARNFGLEGPRCDTNILVKTNLYTHTYIN